MEQKKETANPEQKPHDDQKEEEKKESKAPKTEVEVGRHMKDSKELVAFPKFPAGTKSMLSKFLTHEVWDKLKESHDKYNFTFK